MKRVLFLMLVVGLRLFIPVDLVDAASSFTDETSTYGIGDGNKNHRVGAWLDVDNDGDLDLYSITSGANNVLLLNNGAGQAFTDGTSTYGLADGTSHWWGGWIDVDNDKDFDFYSARLNGSVANTLFRNNGAGQAFTDITSSSNLGVAALHVSSAFIDIDNDNDLDFYQVPISAVNALYINDGTGVFSNATSTYGIAGSTTTKRAVSWIDIDNDGDLDLYIPYSSAAAVLYRNNGAGQAFTDVTSTYGLADGTNAHFSSSWADIDNDGDLDLYIINNAQNNKLYINNGPNTAFTEKTSTYGVANGTLVHFNASWIDIDNDGDLDLYAQNWSGSNNALYINNGPDQSMTDMASDYGVGGGTSRHEYTNWIDIEKDGDIDLYIGTDAGGVASKLFTNPGQGGNYLKAWVNNSSGIYQYNARVEIDLDGNGDFVTGPGKYVMQYQTNSAYGGTNQEFTAQDPVGLYFGLGSDSSCKYDVRIFLPGTDPDSAPDYFFGDVCPNQMVATGWVTVNLDKQGATQDQTPTFSGTAGTTRNTLASASFQIDSTSGSWTSCAANDGAFDEASETFTCAITSTLSEGSHSLYVKAVDSIGTVSPIVTNTAFAGSDGFIVDIKPPTASWTNATNATRTFNLISPANKRFFVGSSISYLPSFSFNQAIDNQTSISKYQVVLKNEKGEEYVYIDHVPPRAPPFTSFPYIIDNDTHYIRYDETDSIFVHLKKEDKKLTRGAYRTKVRALDEANNSLDTSEHLLLIDTHQANFSKTFFPITLLSIGGKQAHITSLDEKTIPVKPFFINSSLPTFFGIAPKDTVMTVVLTASDGETFTYTTTANAESRFGINVTDALPKGVYDVVLSGENIHKDYVEIPFTLSI